jgi:hypothetical protein
MGVDKVWKDEYYLRCHQLAKSGLGDLKIAKALGVTYKTFKRWKVKKRALRNALKDARGGSVITEMETFRDYVYDRLPENLRVLWKAINRCDKVKGSTVEAVEDLLRNQGKETRQHLFLYAMVHANFDPSKACRKVNIKMKTLRKWSEQDPDFADLLAEIHIAKKDFFEAALVQGVKEGDANLIKFANSTLNADRGYNPKQVIEHQGSVEHNHNVLRVDELNLSLEDRRKLLVAYRDRQAALDPKAIRDRDEEPEEGDEEVIDAEFEVKETKDES